MDKPAELPTLIKCPGVKYSIGVDIVIRDGKEIFSFCVLTQERVPEIVQAATITNIQSSDGEGHYNEYINTLRNFYEDAIVTVEIHTERPTMVNFINKMKQKQPKKDLSDIKNDLEEIQPFNARLNPATKTRIRKSGAGRKPLPDKRITVPLFVLTSDYNLLGEKEGIREICAAAIEKERTRIQALTKQV